MSTSCSRTASLVAATALAATLVGTAVGCAGTLEDPGRFLDAEAADASTGVDTGAGCPDLTTVLAQHCALPGCHSTSSMSAGLDLQSPDILGRLTGKPAKGGAGVLIDPAGDPHRSVLYLKVNPDPPFGTQMPAVGSKLDSATIACMAAWIQSVADSGHPAALDAGPGLSTATVRER